MPRLSNFTEGLSRHSLAAAEHKGHEDGINREWTRIDTNENILLVDRCGWSLTRRSSPLFAGIRVHSWLISDLCGLCGLAVKFVFVFRFVREIPSVWLL